MHPDDDDKSNSDDYTEGAKAGNTNGPQDTIYMWDVTTQTQGYLKREGLSSNDEESDTFSLPSLEPDDPDAE